LPQVHFQSFITPLTALKRKNANMAKRSGHLFKRGANFYVRWTIKGKVFSKALRDDAGNSITTEREAKEAQEKVMAPFILGDETAALESIAGKLQGRKAELKKLQDEQNPPLPLAEAWKAYEAALNRPDSGESTLRQYKFQWDAFDKWMGEKHPGKTAVREVSKEIAESYAESLNHGRLSNGTINKHVALLRLVFRVLKKKARLIDDPWDDLTPKNVTPQSRRELTLDELKKVCQSATGELKTLLAIGIFTGLRLGDAATLRWAEVDLARGIIRRIPNKTARRNPKPVLVPIHPSLLTILMESPAVSRTEYVLPDTSTLYTRRIDGVTDQIQNHFLKCGIRVHKPGTGATSKATGPRKRAVIEVGYHSLRHSFVSLCREADAPLSVVESLVGHSNPSMTRHYSHVGEIAAGKAIACLPAVFSADPQTKPIAIEQGRSISLAREMAESMTAENWKEKRDELIALLKDFHSAN
jgi:integrase